MKKKTFSERLAALFCAALMSVPLWGDMSLGMTVSAESEASYEEIIPETQRDEELDSFTEPEYVPMYSFPDEVRGVYINPEKDFSVTDENGEMLSEEEIAAGIDRALDMAQEKSLNAVIISTSDENDIYYSLNVNKTALRSPAEICVERASERGMYVYVTFNIASALAGITEETAKARIDRLALDAHSFTVKYPVDGIIIDGYYSKRDGASFANYIENGSGIGYDNWLMDNGAYVFSLVSDAVRRTSNSVPVGISINDIWANYTTAEGGSETSVSFEALTDGYADTLGYINKGYADFILVKAEGSFGSETMPFEDVVSWWNEKAQAAGVPMIVDHINERVCSDYTGWGSPDELVKQVIKADEFDSCIGSVFNSLSSLEANAEESTTVLVKHFNDQIDREGLNNELEMTLPLTTTFKTEEPTVIFAGSFDPNFTIYFQGEPIELNEAGRFYFNMDLDVGVNTFTFKNKGKSVTYKITRTVNVLKSVEPDVSEMRVEEQSAITFSAIAYKGSDVTAEINGKSVELKPVDGQTDELDPNSNYTKYVGTYIAPAGIKGQDIDLGSVTFYGCYHTKTGDFNETRTGSRIIVNALAEILNDYSGKLLEVKNDNTMVYNAKTTSTNPTPDMARLPAGTLDYQVKTVSYSGTDYYLTNSGKRIRVSDVNVLDNKPLGSNPISVASAGKDGTDTLLKLRTNSRVPFAMSFSGVNYTDGNNGGHYVSSFNATALVITFDYVTSISASSIKFPDSAVFTEGVWDTYESGELTKTRLTLTLRQSGIFGGVTSSYDGEGNLTFRFNGCRSSLNGATVVIDPGHGYTGASQFDPGAVGHIKEQEANLAIAKLVASKLEAEGANVIRLKTESETYVTAQRASIARQYNPDLFLAIHCNAAGESARGAEAYYFTPFSQPLADRISARIGSYLGNNVDMAEGMDRGEQYNYFFVTQQQDFPSVLIECAFVTNYTEAMALADPTHQNGIAEAIVRGAADYLGRCEYSCYGDGSAEFTNSGAAYSADVPEEAPAAEESQPMTSEDVAVTPGFDDPYNLLGLAE
ncbi:MAG: N-acetylmuramoyl-L-alanine amidase [Oscillospiraceae bacterium]|nr:N-acetylmuramoyl-L-alanine amidase [Oscillospiraceae bacterium]